MSGRPVKSATQRTLTLLEQMRSNLTPDKLTPYEENEDGNAKYCQICGEPGDDEMGEFWVEPDPANPLPPPNDKGYSVVAHGQCGIDHGLEIA